MTRLIRAQCVQNLLRRDNLESSLCYQRFEVNIGSRSGTEILTISGSIEHKYPTTRGTSRKAVGTEGDGAISRRKIGGRGGKLLVLGLGRQRVVGFGVVDDIAE